MLTAERRRLKSVPLPNGATLPKSFMTEAEFIEWAYSDEDIRAEWVAGEVVVMSPSSTDHDDLLIWLYSVLRPFVEHHDLGVIAGPSVAVRFASQKRRRLPDLMFVSKSRLSALKKAHFEGAPDLIMEVVSPESQGRDWRAKYIEYEKAGVREYWIIDPVTQQMEVHTLKRGRYTPIVLGDDDALRSLVLDGFFLKPSQLWRKPLPKVIAMHKNLGI